MTSLRPIFRTTLCDLLGIEYPILQSGMGGVAGPDLAAEISNAGGLGILSAALLTADQLRTGIREIRTKTTRPFGVNLLLPRDLCPPVPAAAISDHTVQAVQDALNPMRTALGLPPTSARPAPPPDLVPGNLQVILDEGVPVFSVGLGNPGPEIVAQCHRRGTKVIAMVTSAEDARMRGDREDDRLCAPSDRGRHQVKLHLQQQPLGKLQHRDDLVAADAREVLEELIKGGPPPRGNRGASRPAHASRRRQACRP